MYAIQRVELNLVREDSPVTKITTCNDLLGLCKIIYGSNVYLNERCFAFFLDNTNKLLGYCHCGEGGVSSSSVLFRKIVISGLSMNAKGIILVHNHPSGTKIPSQSDIRASQKAKQIFESLEFNLIDHLIFTGDSLDPIDF